MMFLRNGFSKIFEYFFRWRFFAVMSHMIKKWSDIKIEAEKPEDKLVTFECFR